MILKSRKLLLIIGLIFAVVSCEKESEMEDSTTPVTGTTNPTVNLGSSHNTGKNCLSCHKFSVGGSVYKANLTSTYPGSVVKLTTQPNGQGTVLATLTTDNSGNIRSSSSISFGTGRYVSVTGTAGTKFMNAPITSGACSSCHGSSTAKVWAE
jgi:hypothetical protein